MPFGLIKDEMMYKPIVVFNSHSLSRQAKIYSCDDIPQVGSLTPKVVLKRKRPHTVCWHFTPTIGGGSNM